MSLEEVCIQLYSATSQQSRLEAEQVLASAFPVDFSAASVPVNASNASLCASRFGFAIESAADSLGVFQQLLSSSKSNYVITYVVMYLRNIIGKYFSLFSVEQRVQLRRFLLQYLFHISADSENVPTFILNALVSLYSLVVKYGWLDLCGTAAVSPISPVSPSSNVDCDWFLAELTDFFTGPPASSIIALMMIDNLIVEMSSDSTSSAINLKVRRKIMSTFRDHLLLNLYKFGLERFRDVVVRANIKKLFANKPNMNLQLKAVELLSKILLNSLSFDFIGTSIEASNDEAVIIQLPSSWRTIIEKHVNIQVFFDAYKLYADNIDISVPVMESIAQLLSVRKSMFTKAATREAHVTIILQNFITLVKGNIGLQHPSNFHAICRLVFRFKVGVPLPELTALPEYEEWVAAAADFSIKGIRSWQWSPNSIVYLLQFWAKLITSFQHSRTDSCRILEEKAHQISIEFIRVCLDTGEWGIEHPLENEELLLPQLESLAAFSRCNYTPICERLISLYTSINEDFKRTPHATSEKHQEKLSWIIYIFGSMLASRTAYSSEEEQDLLDANMTGQVLDLMMYLQTVPPNLVQDTLDAAVLHFLRQFKETYIGDQSQRSTVVFSRLQTAFGQSVPNLIMQKLVFNLKNRSDVSQLVDKTVRLLADVCAGYNGLKFLGRCDTVKDLLQHHEEKYFPFMIRRDKFKLRTEYYTALTRVLFSEDGSDIETEFEQFVIPFESKLDSIMEVMHSGTFQQEVIQNALIALFRDLRGLFSPLIAKKTYSQTFDWFFPTYYPLLEKTAEVYGNVPQIIIPMLRFICEFVFNKSSRISFDINSASGILIFKHFSKIVRICLEHQISNVVCPKNLIYEHKYKIVARCFNAINLMLRGHYVAFGVFKLYKDPCFTQMLSTVWRILETIPSEDLLSYPKLSRSYFALMESITDEHLSVLPDMGYDLYLRMMQLWNEGVKSVDQVVLQDCCNAIDDMATHIQTIQQRQQHHGNSSKHRKYQGGDDNVIIKYYMMNQNVYTSLMQTLFNEMLMNEENQWALSRPLLPLALMDRQSFHTHIQHVIETTAAMTASPGNRRQVLFMASERLLNDMEPQLSSKNRDRFTANLSSLKRELDSNTNSLSTNGTPIGSRSTSFQMQ